MADNQYALAVVHAFQALELSLQSFLEDRMLSDGLSHKQVAQRLRSVWPLKRRMKEFVPTYTGKALSVVDNALWARFCWAHDEIRSEFLHAARALDREKTEKAVTACRDVHDWLKSLG